MKRTVGYRVRARDDLIQIGEYGRREWGSARARDYLLEIARRVALLAENPFLGPEAGLLPAELRKFRAGNHLILYLVGETEIEVVRVLHERMDVDGRLD